MQIQYSWSYRFALSATATLITSFNMVMQDVTWFGFVKTFWTRIRSVFFLRRHYHRTCHQLNIYVMNSVDVIATVKIHRKYYRSCVTHLCTSGTTSYKPWSNDWLVLCVKDAKLSLMQEVVTLVTELRKSPYCMTISVCPWFVLIMMLRNFVDIALFVMPIWIKIIRFLTFFFSMWKYWAPNHCIVSFVD